MPTKILNLARRVVLAAFLLSVFSLPAAESGSVRKPNIIFILADDLGYGDLSCNGNPIVDTPNIDLLGREGIRFTDYQVSPLCSPSRCAFMTGRHEYRAGVYATRPPGCDMSLEATTIAQVLRSAGYTSGIFGKWHLGDEPAYQPNARGFDESLIFLSGMIAEKQHANASRMNPILLRNGSDERTTGYDTNVYFTEAIKWIDKVQGTKPFFAYIPTGAPHMPQRCPEEFAKPFVDKVGSQEMANYYGVIANLDQNIGRLLQHLNVKNLEQDTLVVFMSDNGATKNFKEKLSPVKVYNAGMSGSKGSVREGGTRVPSFWRWPGGFKGDREVDQLASNIDFFPTIAELTGAEIPKNLTLDGRSLAPLLNDSKAPWPDRMVFIHESNWGGNAAEHKSGWAVRNNQYRLVEGKALYDIKADRGEVRDVSSEHPEIVASMTSAYDKWWDEVLPSLEKEQQTLKTNAPRKKRKAKAN